MRQLPIGAEPGEEGTHFRVWAPRCARVDVLAEGGDAFVLAAAEAGGSLSETAQPRLVLETLLLGAPRAAAQTARR